MVGTWNPVLTDAIADAARAVYQDIATELTRVEFQDGGRGEPASLASGYAGIALLYAYLDVDAPDPQIRGAAVETIDRALERTDTLVDRLDLFSGCTGLGWALAHLEQHVWQTRDVDDLAHLDDVVCDYLGNGSMDEMTGYDVISGWVGQGVYALERGDTRPGRTSIARIVARLSSTAERMDRGLTWRTPPEQLVEHQRRQAPDGYYNLGLAHGVPGIIAFLSQVLVTDAPPDGTLALLEGACAWLSAEIERDPDAVAVSYWIAADELRAPSRAAWCYGDPGVAIALMQAAHALNDDSLRACALMVAKRAAERPPGECGVVDAGLCHGAAGLGHIFNRLYQATGEPVLRRAAIGWFQRTLDMRRPGNGIAGYVSREPGIPPERFAWLPVSGLLTGVAGIGLALLGACSSFEPNWDRCLLCNLRVRA